MDAVELAMAYEESFGVSIPEGTMEKMRTPNDVIEWLMAAQKRGEFRGPRLSRAEIAEEVRRSTLDVLGLAPERYSEHARFVEDFGAD